MRHKSAQRVPIAKLRLVHLREPPPAPLDTFALQEPPPLFKLSPGIMPSAKALCCKQLVFLERLHPPMRLWSAPSALQASSAKEITSSHPLLAVPGPSALLLTPSLANFAPKARGQSIPPCRTMRFASLVLPALCAASKD
jgi:hypothetical protein